MSEYPYDDYFDEPEFDEEGDEYEEAMGNCHGWFENNGKGSFVCGAVGSEDCDACPFYRDLGLTAKQVEDRDMEEMTSDTSSEHQHGK